MSMNVVERADIFYTNDGVTTHGPYSADVLCQWHASGSMTDGTLCSTPAQQNYEVWMPLAKFIKPPAELGWAARGPKNLFELFTISLHWFVGMNISDAGKMEAVKLVNVGTDFLTVEAKGGASVHHIPFAQINSITEAWTQLDLKLQRPSTQSQQPALVVNTWGGDLQRKPPELMRAKVEVLLSIQIRHAGPIKAGSDAATMRGLGF
jgi:hypothetical protein